MCPEPKHSLRFLEMALETKRHEIIENCDGHGTRKGDCGDTVEFFIKIEQDRLVKVSFYAHGCIHTNACCNALAHMVEGQAATKAWDITPEAVIDYLETLPQDHHHCAELAVGALYLAMADYLDRKRKE